jgi:tRNA dimethylallyltransferase
LSPSQPLLIAIIGPTGSGKTVLSLALAERFGGEIVNCDSVALYREFQIGTAKPNEDERSRAPHHLFDIAEPTEHVTAGEYARRARAVLQEIKSRVKLPIVVGIRDEKSPAHLHRILLRLDPEAATRIHANDQPKLIRAIEVCLSSRQKMSDLWQQGREPLSGFGILRIGLDPERNALYTRINERARKMFDKGLVQETKRLLEKYGESAYPLSSLGYKQAVQFLRGEIDSKLAVWTAQQAHRNYAKRQITWFRREPDVQWLHGFGDEPAILQQALALAQAALSKP